MNKFLFVLLVILIFSQKVNALTIYPATIEIETEDGVTATSSIKIYNESKRPVTINAYTWDLFFDKNGQKLFAPPSTKIKNSIAKYIETSTKEFVLESKETKEVTLLFNLPKGLSGGNSAIVFFHSKPYIPAGSSKKALVAVTTRLGATILQETKNTVQIKSRITGVKITRDSANEPLNISIKVLNEGNGFISASAMISIFDAKNNFYGSVNTEKKILPPKMELEIKKEFKKYFPTGEYHAFITYQFKGKFVTIDKVFKLS